MGVQVKNYHSVPCGSRPDESSQWGNLNEKTPYMLHVPVSGSATFTSPCSRTFAYLLNNPAAMRRCQSEIDDVIGRERAPSMKDKVALPYVEATIWEVHRMASVVPFGVSEVFHPGVAGPSRGQGTRMPGPNFASSQTSQM